MNQTPFPLPEEFYQFVEKHRDDDPKKLRLEMHGKDPGFDVDFAITQIEARRKFGKKIPSFIADPKFIFPSILAGEQATNEWVARFHKSLIPEDTRVIIDMTAGLGIDAMTFASDERLNRIYAVEIDLLKQQCLRNNAETLGRKSLLAMCADSTTLYRSGPFDPGTVIFIDPHRRNSKGGRVYGLKDCVPDVTELLPLWKEEPIRVYLKLSPMLDIDQTLRDLPEARRVWIVSFKGEVKEVLVEAEPRAHSRRPQHDAPQADALHTANAAPVANTHQQHDAPQAEIAVVDIDETGVVSEFVCSHEFSKVGGPVLSDEKEIEQGHYLYVPSPGMMKLGASGAVCARYPGLTKLSGSTPLFTSMWYYRSFPGRVLTIDSTVSSGELKRMKGERMNVIARNYPLSAEELRKKASLKEGGSKYLVGARVGSKSKPTLFLCSEPTETE